MHHWTIFIALECITNDLNHHVGVLLVLGAVISLGARSLLLEKFKKSTKKEDEESEGEIQIMKKVTKKENKKSESEIKIIKNEDTESEIVK